jgi:hypothetical protein
MHLVWFYIRDLSTSACQDPVNVPDSVRATILSRTIIAYDTTHSAELKKVALHPAIVRG